MNKNTLYHIIKKCIAIVIVVLFIPNITYSAVTIPQKASTAISVSQWRVAEITLKSTKKYGRPLSDVSINAVFSGPDERIIEIPGFWDGGDVWKVRFSPTMVGIWTYAITCSDKSNAGLNNKSGSVKCTKNISTLPIYQHGFVNISNNKRNFSYNDGTPFFWLGDTHWGMTEEMNKTNYPGMKTGSQFKYTVDDRIKKGFTVYQAYPWSLNPIYWKNKYDQLDPEGFKNQLDKQIQYLADKGVVLVLGMGWFGDPSLAGKDGMELFARYMVARYSAYPIVWFTGQEVDIQHEANRPEVWYDIAKLIKRYDGYKRPLSGHMQANGDPKTWGTEYWHDWFATQGGHSAVRTQNHYESYWDYSPRKPFIETEAMYEGVNVGGAVPTVKDVRIAAYKAFQCGSYGYTYGAVGVWRNKWDDKSYDNYDGKTPWYVGLNLPGSTQMMYFKNFYTALNWSKLTPRFNDKSWAEFKNSEQAVLSTIDTKTYVVYFYNNTLDTGKLKNMIKNKTYSGKWYNPRTGEYKKLSNTIRTTDGSYNMPLKPDKEDWVFLMDLL